MEFQFSSISNLDEPIVLLFPWHFCCFFFFKSAKTICGFMLLSWFLYFHQKFDTLIINFVRFIEILKYIFFFLVNEQTNCIIWIICGCFWLWLSIFSVFSNRIWGLWSIFAIFVSKRIWLLLFEMWKLFQNHCPYVIYFFFFVLDWSVSNAISVYFSFYLRYIFLIRVLWIGHIYEFWQTKTIYILIYLSIIKHRNIYTYKYIREILNVITREAWSLLHVQHKIVFEWHEYVTLS